MDYEKRYKEVLAHAREIHRNEKEKRRDMEWLFPELKESEDEKIRKRLITDFGTIGKKEWGGLEVKDILAWLEKQGQKEPVGFYYVNSDGKKFYSDTFKYGDVILHVEKKGDKSTDSIYSKDVQLTQEEYDKRRVSDAATIKEVEAYKKGLEDAQKIFEKQGEQKPANKVEPKFKVGDWVIQGCNILKIRCVGDEYYCYETVGGYVDDMLISEIDSLYHLWTIQDAKDGDVLCCESGWTCIFKTLNSDNISFSSYCFMDNTGWFCETGSESHTLEKAFIKAYNGNIYPATKEQRDLLFQKMKEAGYLWNGLTKRLINIKESGYKWDDENKKLKKTEKKPNGGIVREDFNEGDGFYKVELGYLSKLQVEEIEKLVEAWQIPNYDRVEDCISNILADVPNDRFEDFKTNLKDCLNWVKFSKLREWSEEDEKMVELIDNAVRNIVQYRKDTILEMSFWLKSLKQRIEGNRK